MLNKKLKLLIRWCESVNLQSCFKLWHERNVYIVLLNLILKSQTPAGVCSDYWHIMKYYVNIVIWCGLKIMFWYKPIFIFHNKMMLESIELKDIWERLQNCSPLIFVEHIFEARRQKWLYVNKLWVLQGNRTTKGSAHPA